MTTKTKSYEGIANGTALTTTTNGTSDDAWAFVTVASGSMVASNAFAAHGTISRKVTGASGAATSGSFQGLSSATIANRTYIYLTAINTDDTWIVQFLTAAPARIASWHLDPQGKLNVRSAATGSQWVATAVFPLNQWVRVEMSVNIGTTTSNGTLSISYYLGDSTTAVQSFTSSAMNVGTANVAQVDSGKLNSNTYTTPFYLDDEKTDNTTSTFLGPVGAVPAPAVSAGAAVDVTAGGSASFTSTGTSSGGTIASATGSFTILPPGATAPTLAGSVTGTGTASAALNQTATLTTPGAYGWTASYSDGTLTTNATQMAYVSPASATFADPQSITLGVWTNQGGAATAQAAIADTNAATYLEGAPGNPVIITLPPMPLGALTIECSGYYNLGALTRTLTLYMADGATQVDTTSYALPGTDGAFTWAANDAGNRITTVALRRALVLKVQDA
jgi:hypothetical protein